MEIMDNHHLKTVVTRKKFSTSTEKKKASRKKATYLGHASAYFQPVMKWYTLVICVKQQHSHALFLGEKKGQQQT